MALKSTMSKRTKVQLHKERAFPTKRKLSCQKIFVYEATITCHEQNYGQNIYIGIAEFTLNKRCSTHKSSFNLEYYFSRV